MNKIEELKREKDGLDVREAIESSERVNDIETPGCMKLLSKDRTIARWSPIWVD